MNYQRRIREIEAVLDEIVRYLEREILIETQQGRDLSTFLMFPDYIMMKGLKGLGNLMFHPREQLKGIRDYFINYYMS